MATRFLAVLVALALIGAACGDDSDGDASSTVESSTTTGSVDDSDPADDPDSDDPESDGQSGETDEPVVLTASDIGVTETAIRLGIVFPDTTLLGRDPGDLEAKFQVIADEVNEVGGVHGRMIELYFQFPNPLDGTTSDAACVDLVEDRQVFAALGLFVLTTADCYAGLNDTPVVSAFGISKEQMDGYSAVAITIDAHSERLVADRVAALIDGGVLAEGMAVAVVGGVQAERGQENYVAALGAAGIDVVADTLIQGDAEDLLDLTAEMQTLSEVWQSSGAEAVVASAGLVSQALLIAYNNSAITLPIILPEDTGVDPSLLQDAQGLDLTPFELATALIAGDSQPNKYEAGIDGVRECVDRFQDATGEEVALDESRNNLGPTIVACQVFDIFVAIAEAAGPDLTRDSYRAAAEGFGPIEVTDLAEASLGPDKFDLNDSVGLIAEFNPDTVQFEPDG